MKLCAAAVIAARPTHGVAALIFNAPSSEKNLATLSAFWLHQAAVYLVANSFNSAEFMTVGPRARKSAMARQSEQNESTPSRGASVESKSAAATYATTALYPS